MTHKILFRFQVFQTSVHEAITLGFTVFHTALSSDDFVANCQITFEELLKKDEAHEHDIWINLEPGGKIHVVVSLDPSEYLRNLKSGTDICIQLRSRDELRVEKEAPELPRV